MFRVDFLREKYPSRKKHSTETRLRTTMSAEHIQSHICRLFGRLARSRKGTGICHSSCRVFCSYPPEGYEKWDQMLSHVCQKAPPPAIPSHCSTYWAAIIQNPLSQVLFHILCEGVRDHIGHSNPRYVLFLGAVGRHRSRKRQESRDFTPVLSVFKNQVSHFLDDCSQIRNRER